MFINLTILILAIIGLHTVTRDGMLFGFVEKFWLSKGDPEIGRPISECVICMSSFWGVLYYITMVSGWLPGLVVECFSIVWFVLAAAGAINLIVSNVDF